MVILVGVVMLVLSFHAEDRGDWDSATWRRCADCGGKLVRTDDRGLAAHVGHRLRRATALEFNEWLRICLGLL